jgi:quinolinate synthase
MARNTLEKLRDCMRDGRPEVTWRPEFDKAKEVLERSLLNPPPAQPVRALDGD